MVNTEIKRRERKSLFAVAGATEVQTFEWIQTRVVDNRTLIEALSSELDIGAAEAIARTSS
ncbi:hypothetical protein [Leptolyngbya sp. PCC 6406]|uniref:hypothetical protein n=1 Tax=Leptolyngbya sp. PCC 6406 TaxID=1173264 RepID=UPI0002E3FD03|nr:hypothetical protein [Leptolyngbya sp. PCC 6406]